MLSKESILNKIKSHKPDLLKLGISQVGLFGSYLRDEQSDKSDIDILLEFDSGQENFDNYMDVCDLLENMFKRKRIEIVTKNGLSP